MTKTLIPIAGAVALLLVVVLRPGSRDGARTADEAQGANDVKAHLITAAVSSTQPDAEGGTRIDGDRGAAEASADIQHWLLSLPDETYREAYELLLDAEIGEQERSALMADLVARPLFVSMPYLANLATKEDHPFREDARAFLIARLGNDYGSNAIGWADGVRAYLETLAGGGTATVLQDPDEVGL